MHQMTNRDLLTAFLPAEKTEALFHHFKGFRNMIRAPYEEFLEVGLNKHEIRQVKAVLELSRSMLPAHQRSRKSPTPRMPICSWPSHARLGSRGNPLYTLNKRRGILATPLITMGTLNSCSVDPRSLQGGDSARCP